MTAPIKRSSEHLGPSLFEPPLKMANSEAQAAAVALSCLATSSSSSSSAFTAPWFNPFSDGFSMDEAPPQPDIKILFSNFRRNLADLFNLPVEQLLRMSAIIDHPHFSSSIDDENAQFLLNRICSITPSSSITTVRRGLSCAKTLLTKKPHLLKTQYYFNRVIDHIVVAGFKTETLHKQACAFFMDDVLPQTSQPDETLLECVEKYASSKGLHHRDFFNFLLTLPKVQSRFPQDLYKKIIVSIRLSEEGFSSLITLPTISIPETREAIQNATYKFNRMFSCLEKRPEVLNAQMALPLAQRLLEASSENFSLTLHPNVPNCTPEKAKETLFHLIRQDLSGINAAFFSAILADIAANRARIPEDIDQAVKLASTLPAMRLQAPGVLARGLIAASCPKIQNPQTALERCVRLPNFEPRVFSIVKKFLVKSPS